MGTERRTPSKWLEVAEIAESQHGVVARRQLYELGLSATGVEGAVRSGRLFAMHRGVYAVGHRRLNRRGRWSAATLACSTGAVLSHPSAAALLGLRDRDRESAAIHVTVAPTSSMRRRSGIVVHRPRCWREDEVCSKDGISATTPARTIMDLAATLSPRELERTIDQAHRLRLADEAALREIAAVHRGHRGAARLAALLIDHHAGSTFTRSELEERFLALCRDHDIPQPLCNQRLDRYEVDFLWPDHRLVVETDGYGAHAGLAGFERDHERDARLELLGYAVRRFTYRQVVREQAVVAHRVRTALRARARTVREAPSG